MALELLRQHSIDIEEFIVDERYFVRLGCSALLQSDIDLIEHGRAVRPKRLYDYVHGHIDDEVEIIPDNSRYYPSTIPFHLIDPRIKDLAVQFRGNEDKVIFSAFRRIEEIVRKRTGLLADGAGLFAKAFYSEPALLTWDVPDKGGIKGRANLFTAVYMAFRNARAHRELKSDESEALREFLLVNELYRLEADAKTPEEILSEQEEQNSIDEAVSSIKRKS